MQLPPGEGVLEPVEGPGDLDTGDSWVISTCFECESESEAWSGAGASSSMTLHLPAESLLSKTFSGRKLSVGHWSGQTGKRLQASLLGVWGQHDLSGP